MFADYGSFLALIALIPLTLAWRWVGARRRAGWRVLGREDRAPGIGALASWLAALLLIVAAARPLGEIARQPTEVRGRDVVLAIDVSRSMGADDAYPSRLKVAQTLARGVIAGLNAAPHDRVGLVAFAGRGVVRSPLTENLGALTDAIDRLKPGGVQPGGTDVGSALDTALGLFDDIDPTEGRSVVLITDGEDHARNWQRLIPSYEQHRIIVHCFTVGDASAGAALDVGVNEPIVSRRDDASPREIAKATRGAFVVVGTDAVDATALFRDVIDPGARRVRRTLGWMERVELYPWLAVPALALLAFRSAGWFFARTSRVVLWSLLGASLLALPAAAPEPDEGAERFRAGDYEGAHRFYADARKRHPHVGLLAYNDAESLFQLGRFDEALGAYDTARRTDDAVLRAKIDYARGNTLVALGRFEAAVAAYDDCLASKSSLVAVVQSDARINREFAIAQLNQTSTPEPSQPSGGENPRENRPPNASGESSRTSNSGDASRADPRDARDADAAAPPEQTPENRLSDALRNIEDARSQRIDSTEPPRARTGLPDW